MDNQQYHKKVKEYFSVNAGAWVADQYQNDDYSYPVGPNRIRMCLDVIQEKFKGKKLNILDVGCGGGSFLIVAAKLGHEMMGIDQSADMIKIAKQNISDQGVKEIDILEGDVVKTKIDRKFDAITALGLYEYITDEERFFENINKLLKPDGLLLMDCRNRLFNMTSISAYTTEEIKSGAAVELISEIESLYSEIPESDYVRFEKNLESSLIEIKNNHKGEKSQKSKQAIHGWIEGTQQTPKSIRETLKKYGFDTLGYRGVHPHLLVPRLNNLLPPRVFNKLSDSLQALEHLPISLIWSSKFIVIARKK